MHQQTMTDVGTSQRMRVGVLNDLVDAVNELRADGDQSNDLESYRQRDGVVGGGHVLSVGAGADSTKVLMTNPVRYRMDGIEYVAESQVSILQTGEITGSKWGAWRFMVGKTGVVTNQRATANGTSGTMAFDNEEDALLSLSQVARTADTIDIGYLSIDAAAGGFTPGTDDPDSGDGQVDTNNYYDVRAPRLDNGLTADPSVGLSEGTNNDEYAHGTIDVRTNGLNKAQRAADTTIEFSDADIITTSGKYGAELFVTDLAGTLIKSLAGTGIAGSAQTQDHDTVVLATAALDAVQLALPHIFTVIGRVTVLANKGSFTFNTDDLAGTDGTPIWTDEEAVEYDRTDTSAPGVGIDDPAIPAAPSSDTPSTTL